MSRYFSRARRRTWIPLLLMHVGVLTFAACGGNGSAGPATPGPTPASGDQLVGLNVTCQAALLIGERAPCVALASYSSGRLPVVSFESTWSTSRPDVVTIDNLGLSTGKAGGEATITAVYQGRQAT